MAWTNGAVAFGFARGKLPWDRPLTSSERYGEAQKEAVAAMEHDVGSLAVLPAAWVFALRYRLTPIAFGWAAHPQWFERDMYSLDYLRGDLPLTVPETRSLLRGVRFDDSEPGACLVGSRATAVFSLQWPVTTRVRLLYDATAPTTLSARTSARSSACVRHGTYRRGRSSRASSERSSCACRPGVSTRGSTSSSWSEAARPGASACTRWSSWTTRGIRRRPRRRG